MARNDLARPRAGFRTVQDGTLAQDYCPRCRGVLYRVPEGSWFHWSTLGEACVNQPPLERPSEPREGPKSDPRGLDTPARGLARAGLSSTYRRPSWEWMGCK